MSTSSAAAAAPLTQAPAQAPATAGDLLAAFADARVAIFGDLCVDAYWLLDERQERSVETGLPVRHVGAQRYGLGAAGNVAANVVALAPRHVELVGLVGDDIFGDLFVHTAEKLGVVTSGVLRAPGWQTQVYAKPIAGGAEDQRFDFGAGNRLDDAAIEAVIGALEAAAGRCAAVVINQQVGEVLADARLVARVNAVIARHPRTAFVVDARVGCDRYLGAAVKLNVREALAVAAPGEADAETVARRIAAQNGKPVFLTRGAHGLVAFDGDAATEIPGIQIIGATDPVGAGDTVMAVLAAALAVAGKPAEAARLANLAAAVTVRKLNTTGTASVAEIRACERVVDYIYRPELAEDISRAQFHVHAGKTTEIEVIERPAAGLAIAHAIFDHDGTISTLRQGWERIMEPMMVRAVLGAKLGKVPLATYQEVVGAVKRLIDQTTGIQTLAQMKALAALVRQYGFVPEAEVLDEAGYKRIYNDELIAQVSGRLAKFQAGELASADYQVSGALKLLVHLRGKGVRCYLASGTDEADVKAEAAALGYAELFDGGIFGAVGSLAKEAKRDVIERILRENGITGDRLMVVGDGPVEMREGLRRGALCIGVASDEPRRYGLDAAKRTRLIRAGAHLIVPDFTQLPQLLPLINLA
jgi:rfaE bifunctional protein kinase chain/domain